MRILVVEDDQPAARFIEKGLREDGHTVTVCADGLEGQTALLTENWDVVVLDVMLPQRNGFELLRQARQAGVQTPVLFLTARDAIEDRVRGLDLGADDYLVKPFAFAELVARLHALARRPRELDPPVARVGPVVHDRRARQMLCHDQPLQLTPREYSLLELLVRNAGRTLTRTEILQAVWGDEWDRGTNVVDVYINYLRRKLRERGAGRLIETVRGVGYRLIRSP